MLSCVSTVTPKKNVGILRIKRTKKMPILKKDFLRGKKLQIVSYEHQNSSCLKAAPPYHLLVPPCADVGESMDSHLIQRRQLQRKYLLEVIKCLRYLSRQGHFDILMTCSLSLDDCRGQTYDGASNMMGKNSGVFTKINEEQP